MSEELEPAEAISRVPAFAGHTVAVGRRLHGLTNRSWLLEADESRFVLRLPTTHSLALPLDRRVELMAHQRAARAALAPPVVYADPASGILVTRFADGARLDPRQLREPLVLDRLAGLLRTVHELDRTGHPFDAHAAAEHYRREIDAAPAFTAAAARCVAIVDATASDAEPHFCHNDVVAANVIVRKPPGSLMLLDWEYAADNDPFFDLAMPVAYHELGAPEIDRLLGAYSGMVTGERRERLDEQVRRCNALHWLWLARRQVISPEAGVGRTLERLLERLR